MEGDILGRHSKCLPADYPIKVGETRSRYTSYHIHFVMKQFCISLSPRFCVYIITYSFLYTMYMSLTVVPCMSTHFLFSGVKFHCNTVENFLPHLVWQNSHNLLIQIVSYMEPHAPTSKCPFCLTSGFSSPNTLPRMELAISRIWMWPTRCSHLIACTPSFRRSNTHWSPFCSLSQAADLCPGVI